MLEGLRFQVIGIFEEKGSSFGGNQDNFSVIPITAHMNKFGKERSFNIMVQSPSRAAYDDVYDQVHFAFRSIRHLRPNEEDDFAFFSNDSLIEQFNDFTKYVKWGIIVISSIALLAAGIGLGARKAMKSRKTTK